MKIKNMKRKIEETENWINKRVMSENIMLYDELPRVNVYLSNMGVKGDRLFRFRCSDKSCIFCRKRQICSRNHWQRSD